ncbi:MAG: hypothetical protein H0X72_15670 [Acidobacteria bacterium]|nr:hypothetical protein [Acidobacteriota bacterium]
MDSNTVDASQCISPSPTPIATPTPNGDTGNLEICKRVLTTATNTGDLANRVFNFTITGVNIPKPINVSVRAGFRTSNILVPAGPAVITENNNTTNALGGDPRTGNFALVAVNALSANPTTGGSSLGTSNFATRTAN